MSTKALERGRFITFEGIDGAGKTTHIEFVTGILQMAQKNVVVTREPGGTELGEQLRQMLLHRKMNLETEALLMFAARKEHIEQVIEPALSRGDWVVSDRFTDASFAYQGGGRGLSLDKIQQLENWVHPHLQPDLTLLFDVPTNVANARLESVREKDRFESEREGFFQRVRAEYLRRAEVFPERFRVIDSTQPIIQIQILLKQILYDFL